MCNTGDVGCPYVGKGHPDGGTNLGKVDEWEEKEISENGWWFQMELQRLAGPCPP